MGPKNPGAHVSHDDPVNPAGQVQTPEAEQTPDPEQAGEQASDCMSRSVSDFNVPAGSWVTSGTASQMMTRSFEPELRATHTLGEMARELAVNGVEVLTRGPVGNGEKPAWPEYSFWAYTARPGSSARSNGREIEDVAFSNPVEGLRVADEEVRML